MADYPDLTGEERTRMTHTHIHRFDGITTLEDLKDAVAMVHLWHSTSEVRVHNDQIEIWYTEEGE